MNTLTRSKKVHVKLVKHCACGKDLSIMQKLLTLNDFGSKARVAEYEKGVCLDCSWNEAHADGKDHFMESKAAILNGQSESQYQRNYGQAWNE